MKQFLIAAAALASTLGVAEADNNGSRQEQVTAERSVISELTRGAAVSEAIRSFPNDPVEPGERGRTVRDIIDAVPPNPIRDEGPGLGD